MAGLRTFVAIELPEKVREHLNYTIERLRSDLPGIRWVRPHGFHLTLKFLGEVEEERVPHVVEAVNAVAGGLRPLTLRVAGIGGFPQSDRARVVWVGIEGELEALSSIQERVEQALDPLGFSGEERKFHPHVTLGRVSRRPVSLARACVDLSEGDPFSVDRVQVIRSDLHRDGARYTTLGCGMFGDPA